MRLRGFRLLSGAVSAILRSILLSLGDARGMHLDALLVEDDPAVDAGKLAGGAGTEVVLQLGLLQVLAATLTLKPHHDPEGEGRGTMEGRAAGGDAEAATREQRAESEGEPLECTTVALAQVPSLAQFIFFFGCWWWLVAVALQLLSPSLLNSSSLLSSPLLFSPLLFSALLCCPLARV